MGRITDFRRRSLLITHGIYCHLPQPPSLSKLRCDLCLVSEILLLNIIWSHFQSNQFANVMEHSQHKGFVRRGVAGKRGEGFGGQRGGERVAPEITKLLPLVCTKIEHQLPE